MVKRGEKYRRRGTRVSDQNQADNKGNLGLFPAMAELTSRERQEGPSSGGESLNGTSDSNKTINASLDATPQAKKETRSVGGSVNSVQKKSQIDEGTWTLGVTAEVHDAHAPRVSPSDLPAYNVSPVVGRSLPGSVNMSANELPDSPSDKSALDSSIVSRVALSNLEPSYASEKGVNGSLGSHQVDQPEDTLEGVSGVSSVRKVKLDGAQNREGLAMSVSDKRSGDKETASATTFSATTVSATREDRAGSSRVSGGERSYSSSSSSYTANGDGKRDFSKEPMGARIKVIGIGGGGGNAINNMIRSGLRGVEFVAANTDAQALRSSEAQIKLQLGEMLTKGLGAGANPEVGEAAARESEDEIRNLLTGADMVFVTAGMGGGTGGGGASVVARIAREVGALTVGVVTKPFLFEGKQRLTKADQGIALLEKEVDTLITIPNQRLLSIAGRNTTLLDTFRKADEVLYQAVKGISDLILFEGLVNVDFADVKAVMSEMGMAMMGSGESSGENRAIESAEKAISSPLLEDVSIRGARGVLINVTAGPDVTLQEINEAAELIHSEAHEDANIIWGMVIDPEMQERVRVTVIATGFGESRGRSLSNISTAKTSYSHTSTTRGGEREIDTPAYARRTKEAISPSDTVKLRKVSMSPIEEEEEKYEIPTFLRRQVD